MTVGAQRWHVTTGDPPLKAAAVGGLQFAGRGIATVAGDAGNLFAAVDAPFEFHANVGVAQRAKVDGICRDSHREQQDHGDHGLTSIL